VTFAWVIPGSESLNNLGFSRLVEELTKEVSPKKELTSSHSKKQSDQVVTTRINEQVKEEQS